MSVHRFKRHKRQKEIKHYTSLLCRFLSFIIVSSKPHSLTWGHCGRDRMVVGFTTTYAIGAYHHWRCEFESHSGKVYSMQHYVVKFVSDLRQVGDFLWVFQFPPSIKLKTKVVNPIKIYIYSGPFNINLLVAFMSVCVVYIPLLVVSLFFVFCFCISDCHYTQTFHRT
jgi:hypothetical protein